MSKLAVEIERFRVWLRAVICNDDAEMQRLEAGWKQAERERDAALAALIKEGVERDKAREVAKSFYLHVGRTPEQHAVTMKRSPWLEE